MIRKFEIRDTAAVMQVWLETIVEAHDFVNESYWHGAIDNMRSNYLLNSESYVYTVNGGIVGFISIIEDNTIGAIFVEKPFQKKGIGTQLMDCVKENHEKLYISVYEKNEHAQEFLSREGFSFEYRQHDENTNETELLYIWEREKMNYKMIIQFDGGRYRGFQKQTGTKENESTIQGKLESVIRTFTGHEVQLIGCGRTDAGVHSENYTANFHTEIRLDEAELLHHFDMYLPEDIFVKDVSIVSDRFHSRYNAHSKTYQYRISTDRNRNVFTRKYSYHINEMPDMEKMRTMAQEFIGEKDFSGFTNLKSKKKSTVRKIYRIDIHQDKNGEIMIDIEGNGFLQNMARIIAGTILEAGTGKRDTESVRKIFSGGAREDAGAMLPSQGLKLLNVKY